MRIPSGGFLFFWFSLVFSGFLRVFFGFSFGFLWVFFCFLLFSSGFLTVSNRRKLKKTVREL